MAQGPFLAGFEPVTSAPAISYGLQRLDHAVGNVHKLIEAASYVMGFTGEWPALGCGGGELDECWAALVGGRKGWPIRGGESERRGGAAGGGTGDGVACQPHAGEAHPL